LPLVNNERHFTWTAKYVFICISAPTRGNYLDRYTNYFPRMRIKNSKSDFDRAITKGTLLGEQGTFSSVSRLLPQEIPWVVILIIFGACAIKTKFCCDRSIMKGTYDQSDFWSVSRLLL
jgi:hypothetical protein